MSVNPGFGGQRFIRSAIEKIITLKRLISERNLSTIIEVDGGVKTENLKDIMSAGADIFVMGSAFFKAKDYGQIVREFRDITENR
jgi:ribulose-phosphate 3-epimerase